MTSPRLNFAGFLAKHCITSKLTPVFIIVVALMGSMAERLRSTENVSVVSLRGGQHREIAIELDPNRLRAYGVTLGQAQAAFSAGNLSVPLPPSVRDGQVQAIKLDAAYASAEDVRNQLIAVRDKRPVYVRDVAKKKGANAVVVADAVIDRMQRMQATFVPQDIQVVVTRNDGQKADAAINLLLEHLTIALVTVGLALFFFLGWREALIVMVTVPLIMGITQMANLVGGITINRITLFALILALGLLVDAAIVVIENLHRHYASHHQNADKQATTVLAGSINIMQDRITRSRMAGDPPEITLSPRLSHLGLLEFDQAAVAIEEGRNCVQRMRPALDEVLTNL